MVLCKSFDVTSGPSPKNGETKPNSQAFSSALPLPVTQENLSQIRKDEMLHKGISLVTFFSFSQVLKKLKLEANKKVRKIFFVLAY